MHPNYGGYPELTAPAMRVGPGEQHGSILDIMQAFADAIGYTLAIAAIVGTIKLIQVLVSFISRRVFSVIDDHTKKFVVHDKRITRVELKVQEADKLSAQIDSKLDKILEKVK